MALENGLFVFKVDRTISQFNQIYIHFQMIEIRADVSLGIERLLMRRMHAIRTSIYRSRSHIDVDQSNSI